MACCGRAATAERSGATSPGTSQIRNPRTAGSARSRPLTSIRRSPMWSMTATAATIIDPTSISPRTEAIRGSTSAEISPTTAEASSSARITPIRISSSSAPSAGSGSPSTAGIAGCASRTTCPPPVSATWSWCLRRRKRWSRPTAAASTSSTSDRSRNCRTACWRAKRTCSMSSRPASTTLGIRMALSATSSSGPRTHPQARRSLTI